MRSLVVLAAIAAALALMAGHASAEDENDIWRAGARINVVPDGHHDVWAAGALVSVRGAIANELHAAGAEVAVDSQTQGDAYVAGAVVSVAGNYGHNLYVAGARVDVAGKIAGALKAVGARVLVGPQTEVTGSLQLGGADVVFSGTAKGAAEIYGDTVRIDGRIAGDLVVRARNVAVGPTAVVEGNARFETLNEPDIAQGATIRGRQTVTLPRPPETAWKTVALALVGTWLFGIAAGFVAGLVLLIVGRPFVARSVDALRGAPARSGLIGLAVLILLPLVAVLLMATVVGLPVGFLSLLALPLAWLVATVIAAFALGDILLNRARVEQSFMGRLGLLVAGLFVLGLLGLIPVVGFITWLLALVFGLGAVWQGLRRPGSPEPRLLAT